VTIERRLVFGQVAELYDASRPSYPPAMVEELLRRAGARAGDRVLEVGAGTGKATTLFAARGLDVVAIEPSPEMAAVARRNCAPYPQVRIVESDFEQWDPGGRRFPLLYSAQAWHWIDPELGLERAHLALLPGGLLAPFWNRPAWGRSALRDELIEVYRATVPELEPTGPMHPANFSPLDGEDWVGEIAAVGLFEEAEVVDYHWHVDYSADRYVDLLGTLSDVRLLDDSERRRLTEGVHAAIERQGGTLPLPLLTRVCLARAV
jgi:SAM-dependent methyltransferase